MLHPASKLNLKSMSIIWLIPITCICVLPFALMMRSWREAEALKTAQNFAKNEEKDRAGVQVRLILFNALRALEKAGTGGYRSYLSGLIEKGRTGEYIETAEAVAALELTRAEIVRYMPTPGDFPERTRENALSHYYKPLDIIDDAIDELNEMEAGA